MLAYVDLLVRQSLQSWIGVMVAVTAGLVFAIILRNWVANYRIRRLLRNAPTVPGTQWPFLGNALQLMGPRPWERMRQWCDKYGERNAVYFKVLDKHVLYISSPALLKRVLQTQQRYYKKDLASFKHFSCLLGQGLVTSEDEKWRHGRMLLSAAMRIDVLELVPAVGVRAALRLVDRALEGKPIDLDEEYRHLTLQVIGEAVLSLPHTVVDEVFPKLYLPIVTEANLRVWAPWRQFTFWKSEFQQRNKCVADLNTYIADYVRQRWILIQKERAMRAAGVEPARKGDILDRYMTQLSECVEKDVVQVRDDLKTMLLAGHETSAATLTWATYELLCHPQYMKLLVKEYFDIFGEYDIEAGELPPPEELKKLKWAPAILRETMRKHSVVPLVMRVATRDDEVPASESGLGVPLTIPKGCAIMVGIAGVHSRGDLWPDPDVFRPERFLDMEAVDPWAWIPFINGPRNCLGQHLSLLEMQLVLTVMVGKMKMTLLDEPSSVAPHNNTIPVIPQNGLRVLAVARHDASAATSRAASHARMD